MVGLYILSNELKIMISGCKHTISLNNIFRKVVVSISILILISIFIPFAFAQEPIISSSYSTLPENPVVGEPFIFSISISNSGISAVDARINIFTGDENLKIISDGKELSSKSIALGELPPGLSTTGLKMIAEKDGIYEVEVILQYYVQTGDILKSHRFKTVLPLMIVSKPSFKINELNPPVIEPGNTGTFLFDIQNDGGEAREVHMSLIAPDGLITHTSDLYIDRWERGEVRKIPFTISADRNLPDGAYPAYLAMVYSDRMGNIYRQNISLAINVSGIPELIFSGFSTNPERIYPDSNFNIIVSLQNIGKADATGITLTLGYPDGFSGEQKKYIGTIKRDQIAQEEFKLHAGKSLKSGIYRFTLTMLYGGSGVERSVEYPFTIYIDSPGEIVLEIGGLYFSPQRVMAGKDFTLSLQIENAGKQDAKAVSIKLDLPDGFSGKNLYFMGSLQSGDSATSTFDLIAPEKSGEYRAKAIITYLDRKMERHTVEREFSIYVFPEKTYSLEIVGIVAVLILISLGYMFKKRERR